jgi:DNA adenine methylase
LDGELVNLFRMYRERGAELIRRLESTPYSRAEFYRAYQKTDDPMEAARRLVIRSFMGFAGVTWQKTGFRTSHHESRSTASSWKNYTPAMSAVIERLRGVTIENRPAIAVMRYHDSEHTLIYVDPPYLKSTRTDTKDDYQFEMTDADHITLSDVLKDLSGLVMISGYPSELYDGLYSGWERVEKLTVADAGKGNRKRMECLWMNPACVSALKQEGKWN